jgi:hypothetical protein
VLAAQIAGIIDDAAGKGLVIRAIGIGFGGPVNREQGVVATSFHVGGWSDFPLAAWVAEQVRDSLGAVPVVLENDSNAAALGEALVGAGRGARVVVYSNAGSGIGSGLVIDGQLYRGRASGEMELGHLRLSPRCGDPRRLLRWMGDRPRECVEPWRPSRPVRLPAPRPPQAPPLRPGSSPQPSPLATPRRSGSSTWPPGTMPTRSRTSFISSTPT